MKTRNWAVFFDFEPQSDFSSFSGSFVFLNSDGFIPYDASFLYENISFTSMIKLTNEFFLKFFYEKFLEDDSLPLFAFTENVSMFFSFLIKRDVFPLLDRSYQRKISLLSRTVFDKISLIEDVFPAKVDCFDVWDRLAVFYVIFTGKAFKGKEEKIRVFRDD